MPRYSDEIINEVFAENDIVDYVSQYVRLKRSGKDYSGLCPFHGEKTPSFHVSRDKQLFHCFGCGASGNLVQFVMRMEGLDFVEALKVMADRAGIVLPEDNGLVDDELHKKKQRIYQMNKLAARFFYNNLVKGEKGRAALEYFKNRKISPKTITSYGLGYSTDDRRALTDMLVSQGYTEEEILEAGLCVRRGDKMTDKFLNRVIFPIIDLRGNVIGFGGRIMGQAQTVNGFKIPKYLNSPETPVFSKGRNLFSLNFAKNDDSGKIILVEGYMDVISVYQAGIKNITATLGTAITPEQAKLLLRYCSEILLCYDSDEAGEKATLRAIDVINGVGGRAKIIRLKGAKDPDEYINKNGIAAFGRAIDEALPSTEYRITRVRSQYNLDSPEGKVEFISQSADTLLTLQSDVEVDAYIKKLAEETGISREAIYAEYRKKKGKKNLREQHTLQQRPVVLKNTDDSSPAAVRPKKAEALILNLMIKQKKYTEKVLSALSADDFSSSVSKRLLEMISENHRRGKISDPAVIVSEFTGAEAEIVASIFYNNEIYSDNEAAIDDLIIDIKKSKINNEIKETADPLRLKELFEELQRLGRS